MSDNAPLIRGALFDTLTTALADEDVTVFYGHPGNSLPNNIVTVGVPIVDEELGPMGPRRNSEQNVTIVVTISCYKGGQGSAVQRATCDQAFALLNLIRTALAENPHLGLTAQECRQARIVGIEVIEPTSVEQTAKGRVTELAVAVATGARVTALDS